MTRTVLILGLYFFTTLSCNQVQDKVSSFFNSNKKHENSKNNSNKEYNKLKLKNKRISWNKNFENKYLLFIKKPRLLLKSNISGFNFLGWSTDGYKIAYSYGESDCFEGFCDFIDVYEIKDTRANKKVISKSINMGADGCDDCGLTGNESHVVKVKREFIKSMRSYKIMPGGQYEKFFKKKDLYWGDYYEIKIKKNKLILKKTDTNNNISYNTVKYLKGSDGYQILGYYKSPVNKQIVIILKYERMNASGINYDYIACPVSIY